VTSVSNTNGGGWMPALWQPTGGLKMSSSLVYELAATFRRPHSFKCPEWTLAIAWYRPGYYYY